MTEMEDEIELLNTILGAQRALGERVEVLREAVNKESNDRVEALRTLGESIDVLREVIITEAKLTRLRVEVCIKELVEGAVVNVIDPPAEEPEKNRYGR